MKHIHHTDIDTQWNVLRSRLESMQVDGLFPSMLAIYHPSFDVIKGFLRNNMVAEALAECEEVESHSLASAYVAYEFVKMVCAEGGFMDTSRNAAREATRLFVALRHPPSTTTPEPIDSTAYLAVAPAPPAPQLPPPAEAPRGFFKALRIPPPVEPASTTGATGLERSNTSDGTHSLMVRDDARLTTDYVPPADMTPPEETPGIRFGHLLGKLAQE
jgi:hypothetical protein